MSVQIRNPELIRLLAADFVTRRELVTTPGNRITLTNTDLSVSGGGALTLSADGAYTLTIPKTGTVPVGTGTAGRIAEWVTDANTVQASTLAKTGAGVLTLSADGAYTLTVPETGTAVLVAATQTLTNKTLTTPTIGDFSSAQHSHANAAGGGQLSLTAAVSGVLPAANGGTGVNNATRTLTINTNSGTLAFSGAGFTLTVPATGTAAVATGISGGQTIFGGTAASESLTLESTSNATKGTIFLAPSTDTNTHRVGIGSGGALFGKVYIHANTPGETLTFVVENGDNTNANSHARFRFITKPGGGDPFLRFDANTAFAIGIDQSDSGKFKVSRSGQPGTNDVIIIDSSSNVGINNTSPSAQLHVDQSSASGAKPTLRLRQAHLTEEFIRFDTTVGAGNPINTTALGAYYGRVRVWVEGVGAKWLALYNT